MKAIDERMEMKRKEEKIVKKGKDWKLWGSKGKGCKERERNVIDERMGMKRE